MTTDSLTKRYSVKLFSTIVTGIVNAITLALVPSAMGPVAFGQFTYLQQLFNQVVAFLDASTSTAFFTKLSADNNRSIMVLYYLLYCVIVLIFLSLSVYLAEGLGITELYAEGIGFYSVFLGMLLAMVTWFFQIAVKISDAYAFTVQVEISKVVQKLAVLLCLAVWINTFAIDLEGYLIFLIFSTLLFILYLGSYFFRKGVLPSIHQFRLSELLMLVKEYYRYVSPLFVFNSFSIVVALFEIWLLQYMSGAEDVGFYGLAYSIAAMCFIFTSAMTPVITREFSSLYAEGELNEIKRLIELYLPLLYLVAVFLGAFISVNSNEFLYLFADERYMPVAFTLSLIAFYPLHQTYGQITSAVFFASEETRNYRNIGILSSIISLVLSFVFIVFFQMGDEGFAIKMLITQLIGVNIQLFFNAKLLGLNFFKGFLNQIIPLVVIYFVMLGFDRLIVIDSLIFSLFLEAGMAGLTVLALILFFPFLFGIKRQDIYIFILGVKVKLGMDRSDEKYF